MVEHNAQQRCINPTTMKSNTPEEGSELGEEADKRGQEIHMRHLPRNERIRFVIIRRARELITTRSCVHLGEEALAMFTLPKTGMHCKKSCSSFPTTL
jgi:hypothetical protein